MSARPAPSALVAGATGLVGRELALRLGRSGHYGRITALVRRTSGDLPDTVTQVPVNYERLEDAAEALRADHVYCALGTTIRSAGSQEAFRRVDHDYVVALARLALAHGASHFLLVSSLGANPRSRVFYSRVKGEVEAAVQALGYPTVTIVRPSLLLGQRKEFRLGEVLMKPFGPLMPRTYRPVHARAVAATLVRAAQDETSGVRVIESREIAE